MTATHYILQAIPSGKYYENSPSGALRVWHDESLDIRYYVVPRREYQSVTRDLYEPLDMPVFVAYVACPIGTDVRAVIVSRGKLRKQYRIKRMYGIYYRNLPIEKSVKFKMASDTDLMYVKLTKKIKRLIIGNPTRYALYFNSVTINLPTT